jgi:hypothetical protein
VTTVEGGHVLPMSLAANGLTVQLRHVVDVIDRAHTAGLAIPSKATEAVDILHALALCWDANSRGRPAPEEAKATLGIHTCTCDGKREHYCRRCAALTCACGPCDCPPCECDGR